MPDWVASVLEGIFGKVLYDLLLAGAVGALLAYLKAKRPNWAAPTLYAIAGFTAVLVVAYVFVGHALLYKEQPQTTTENVETNIKAWVDAFSLGVKKTTNPQTHFAYSIILTDGVEVDVARRKDAEHYLMFQGTVVVNPEHQVQIKKMPREQIAELLDHLAFELSKLKVDYKLDVDDAHTILRGVTLSKTVPITSGLTEDAFGSDLGEMDSDLNVAREAIRLNIKPHPAPSR